MITAVDTNILIDILEGDVEFGAASAAAFARAARDGALVACDAVWAEVATAYAPDADVADDLRALGLRFLPMSEDAALRAAQAWAGYRRAGGAGVASWRTSSSAGMLPARRTACSRVTTVFIASTFPASRSRLREPASEGAGLGSPTHAVADSLFNGLLSLDEKGEPRPDLALRWSLSEDGLRTTS